MCWLPTERRVCGGSSLIKRRAHRMVGASITGTQIFKINHSPEHPERLHRSSSVSSRLLALRRPWWWIFQKEAFFYSWSHSPRQTTITQRASSASKMKTCFPPMLITCRCIKPSVESCELFTFRFYWFVCFLLKGNSSKLRLPAGITHIRMATASLTSIWLC